MRPSRLSRGPSAVGAVARARSRRLRPASRAPGPGAGLSRLAARSAAERDEELPPTLAPQLVAPRGDFPRQGQRAGLGAGKVHPLQLHHHLAHHVVPAVPVEGEHHNVEGEDLGRKRI